MSAVTSSAKGAGGRLLQAILLVALSAMLWIVTRAVPDFHGGTWTIAAIGFLLLSGTLLSDLVALVGMPHLTGYLLAGIVAGPHVLQLIDHHSVERLSSVNTLALALIALARFMLTFVMTSDLVVVVVLATAITLARPLVEPGATFSLHAFRALGHEILGSVALGTTLGLVLAAYLRLIGKNLLVVFLVLGFGLTEVLKYLNFDPLLTFMVAGFLVQNLSNQGEKFLHALQQTGGVVYVIFFATAGADLDVPLLKQLWPVALVLAGSRVAATYGIARLSSRIANDDPIVKKWGWSGLVSQAGLALGLAAVVSREFPAFGDGFRALAIATIALNEMIGPILFKLALDRAGESSSTPEPSLSIVPEAPKAEET